MKIVKEHIDERMSFTEDGDPIRDMGIGGLKSIMQELDIKEKTSYDIFYNVYTHAIEECIKQNRPDLIQIIFDLNKVNVNKEISKHKYKLLHLALHERDKCLKILLDNGVADDINTKMYQLNFEYMISPKYQRLLKKYIKESLNEKFSEDSDPVKDLGIGLEHFKKKYGWLVLPHYLSGMTLTDKIKVKKAMGCKSGDLFYLGEQNNSKNRSAFVKVYMLRIKRLTEKATVIHKETYTEFLQDEKKNVQTIITSYNAEVGIIGAFEYTEHDFKDIIQYFGDVDALMALKPYEIVAH